jgi:hypothetical protein
MRQDPMLLKAEKENFAPSAKLQVNPKANNISFESNLFNVSFPSNFVNEN